MMRLTEILKRMEIDLVRPMVKLKVKYSVKRKHLETVMVKLMVKQKG